MLDQASFVDDANVPALSPTNALLRDALPASSLRPWLVRELIGRHFSQARGELQIGGIAVGDLVAQFGSPLFVYDGDLVARRWQLLRDTLPEKFQICYSVKANPNQALLRYFVQQGSGLEIASSGELVQALAAGCPTEKILFAGPGKTEAELALVVQHDIGEIHIESLTEAKRIAKLAKEHQRPARISLRVNPAAAVAGGGMRMGAKPAPFGIDEEQLVAVVAELIDEPWLNIVGLHLFIGTQILDHQVLLTQYAAGLEIARRLVAQLKRPLHTIDFGGGLGVPYFPHEKRLDTTALRIGLDELVTQASAEPIFADTRFLVEPGRFLVAEAGLYITRVTDTKTSRDKRFAIVDGGMHHHLAASGNLGQTIKRNFPIAVLNKLEQPATETIDVVGPLCTPLDVLARGIELPPVEIGDLIGVFQSGAYARSASPLGFLSRMSPAEVFVQGNSAQLVRRRGIDDDFLADQILPATPDRATPTQKH